MVNRSNHPWYSKTHEHVDRVTAGNISNSIVSSLLIHSGGFAGKCVGRRGTQGYKGDGSNLDVEWIMVLASTVYKRKSPHLLAQQDIQIFRPDPPPRLQAILSLQGI